MARKIPFFDEALKLRTNIELVYSENTNAFGDSRGITQLAFIHKPLKIGNQTWFEVSLLTDINGDQLNSSNKILVKDIVSLRKYHKIKNRKLYYLKDLIVGTNFASNEKIDFNKKPLETASRTALGSGIYGFNLNSMEEARDMSTDNKDIYEINMSNAYDVQDREHGESITTASLLTNRYLDKIISSIDLKNIENIIKNDNIENLVILWNIVFCRTGNYISYEKLEDILSYYLTEYFYNHELVDMTENKSIIALPINYIMKEMGYDGLIADDIYNNGWDRGCVSYNFNESDPLSQGKALY